MRSQGTLSSVKKVRFYKNTGAKFAQQVYCRSIKTRVRSRFTRNAQHARFRARCRPAGLRRAVVVDAPVDHQQRARRDARGVVELCDTISSVRLRTPSAAAAASRCAAPDRAPRRARRATGSAVGESNSAPARRADADRRKAATAGARCSSEADLTGDMRRCWRCCSVKRRPGSNPALRHRQCANRLFS